MLLVSPTSPEELPTWLSSAGPLPLRRPADAAAAAPPVLAEQEDVLADFGEMEQLVQWGPATSAAVMAAALPRQPSQQPSQQPQPSQQQQPQPQPQRLQQPQPQPRRAPAPPTQAVGIAGSGGAMRVRLAQREPGLSAFASHRGRAAQRGKVDEPKLVAAFLDAVHHGGRTLYGRKCTDLRSFWTACDREGTQSILGDRLSDAMVRLGLGLNKAQAKSLVAGIAVDVPGTCDYLELERWVDKHRSQEKTTAKQKVSGRGWGAAAVAAAAAAAETAEAPSAPVSSRKPAAASAKAPSATPRGTFGASARPLGSKQPSPWEGDSDRCEKRLSLSHFHTSKTDQFDKTGSGQIPEKLRTKKEEAFVAGCLMARSLTSSCVGRRR